MAARLMPQEAIASVLGICDDTLRRHYAEHLRRGDGRACLKVAKSLDKLLEAGSEKTILHVAKVKLRLTETRKHEVTGKGGAPLGLADYMTWSEEDLRKRIAEIDEALGER